MAGKPPSKGTPADQRLKDNKPKSTPSKSATPKPQETKK